MSTADAGERSEGLAERPEDSPGGLNAPLDEARGRSTGWQGGRSSGVRWTLAVALFGLAERLALWLIYAPASYGDTPSYMRLARALQQGGLSAYDGTRVPGYSTFLNLLGQDPMAIWVGQMALGWAASLLLLYLGGSMAADPRFGALVATAYNLTAAMVLFEANLLSETLTTFWVLLSVSLLMALDRQAARADAGGPAQRPRRLPEWTLAAALGLASALAGLTRPLFYILPPVLAVFVWYAGRLRQPIAAWRSTQGRFAPRLARLLAFSLPAALLLGGWLLWVYRSYEMFSPTTMGGYHMVQHTGEYFEYLSDEYAPLRDTYLKYRDAQIAARGTQTNAIWDAIPEMSAVTGLSFFGLSAELQRLSLQLIRQHPLLYLENVVQGWIDFWKAPVYWDAGGLRFSWLRPVFSAWALAGRGLALAANAGFLLASAAIALSRSVRKRLQMDLLGLALAAPIWLASIVQSLADHGDNPRFLIPLQPVVMLLVLRWIHSWRNSQTPKGVA